MTDDTVPDADALGGHMTLFEHLAELRTRLMRMLIAVAVGAVIGFIVYPYLTEFLLRPYEQLRGESVNFLTLDPLEPFAVRIKIAAYLGIAIAMPVILWQIWRFVAPGLYKKEKRYAIPFVVASLLLFVLGAAIAYLTLGPALQFLTTIGGSNVVLEPSPDKYTMLVIWMMLAFGFGMEFPVLLVALQLMGVVTWRTLLRAWRMATVIIVVVAAVITPSGDPISMMALGVPMLVLYFGAIGVGAIVSWRRGRRVTAAGA